MLARGRAAPAGAAAASAAPVWACSRRGGRRLSAGIAGRQQHQHAAQARQQLVVQGGCYEEILDQLAERALAAAASLPSGRQHVVGVAGGPGSGKSTLAAEVAGRVCRLAARRGLGRGAVVAPMDGFHLYRRELDRMPDPQEAHARRGAPWTFDAPAFVEAVRAIRRSGAAALPSFDHAAGDPVEGDVLVDAARHAVVLVEGNYLLLSQPPWDQLRELFDEAWFVDCPVDEAMRRVYERQTAIGLAPEESLRRIAGNDRPNAELVAASRGAADVLVPSTVPFAAAAAAGGGGGGGAPAPAA